MFVAQALKSFVGSFLDRRGGYENMILVLERSTIFPALFPCLAGDGVTFPLLWERCFRLNRPICSHGAVLSMTASGRQDSLSPFLLQEKLVLCCTSLFILQKGSSLLPISKLLFKAIKTQKKHGMGVKEM